TRHSLRGVCAESFQCCREFGVFQIPKRMSRFVLTQLANDGHYLTESQLRTSNSNLAQMAQNMIQQTRCDHNASPTRRLLAFGRFNLPITSTFTEVPGKSLATRVARVTPSWISRTPSDPS